jgi:hypothetical protein
MTTKPLKQAYVIHAENVNKSRTLTGSMKWRAKMNNKEARRLYERKIRARGHKCPVCGEPMVYPQLAHLVGQGKGNTKKYGKAFIHSEMNTMMVCSLECNNSVQLNPATHPVEVENLYKRWRDVWL